MMDTFWLEVGQAYQKVAANHELEITVERADKQAVVYYCPANEIRSEFIGIDIHEVDTHVVETLVSP